MMFSLCRGGVQTPSVTLLRLYVEDLKFHMDKDNSQRPSSLKDKPDNTTPSNKVAEKRLLKSNDPWLLSKLRQIIPFAEVGVSCIPRFKPLLDIWYEDILVIDYFATEKLAPSVEEKKLQEVPVSFRSHYEYLKVFRPLALEEFKAQLQQERVPLDENYCGSVRVISMRIADGFHSIQCVYENKLEGSATCVVNDLVLLMTESENVHMLGKVEKGNKCYRGTSSITVKLYLPFTSPRLNKANLLLSKQTKWSIHRIMNMASKVREFQALSSIDNIPLRPLILYPGNYQPNVLKSTAYLSRLPNPLQNILESSFNECQLEAISSILRPVRSRNEHVLSLIQGPPGTGKTKTIVAIISALLSLAGSNDVPGRRINSSAHFNTVQQTSQFAAVARDVWDAPLATQSSIRGRILICAQSNAAVDEIVSRISSDGLYGDDGKMYMPSLVRLGKKNTIKSSSIPYLIDTIVDCLTEEEKESDMDVGDSSQEVYLKRKKMRDSILRRANIVLTTLSGSGGELYAFCSESYSASTESSLFDAVIIDEAAQALEVTTLIPLQLLKSKGSKTVMVGDPKQLPATVFSDVASKYNYKWSLFERLQKAGYPVTVLTKQYRMHPEICQFPSLHFYDGKLVNGDGTFSKEKPFHKTKVLGPYSVFDIEDGQEAIEKNTRSFYNEREVQVAVELVEFFRKSYPCEFDGVKIGIITPYNAQLSLLRKRFSDAFGSCILNVMELDTVDGFQGREVDILVVSTVRALATQERKSRNTIGFVGDVRRMNVALTRAKHSLWILGNVRTLEIDVTWKAVVEDAKKRNLVFTQKALCENQEYTCETKKRKTDLVEKSGEVIRNEFPKLDKTRKSKGNKRDGEKKIKWKKIITASLKSKADGTLKIKKLKKEVLKIVRESGSTIDNEQLLSIFDYKVKSSSKFSVNGKRVHLVAKS